MSFELARKPTCPVSNFVTASRTVGVQSRTTRAYLARYIRAAATLPRSVVHYAISGVQSQTPTLRLLCAAWHHHAALSGHTLLSSISRPLLMSSRLSPCPRPTARQRSPFFRMYVVFATSCLTSSRAAAGSSASATQSLFKFLLAYSAYATSSSSTSGAAWWIPGGDNGGRGSHAEQGVFFSQLRGAAGRGASPRCAVALLVFHSSRARTERSDRLPGFVVCLSSVSRLLRLVGSFAFSALAVSWDFVISSG